MTNPRTTGPGFSDTITGIFASYGILAALVAWREKGVGQHVDVSMLEATINLVGSSFVDYLGTGDVETVYDRPHTSQAYAFQCGDGRPVAIHLSSPPKFWQALVRALGREDLIEDPRFLSKDGRIDRYDEIHAELSPIFATKPRSEWLGILDKADVPAAPLYTVDESLQDPQVKHLGVEKVTQHPVKGEVRMPGFPVHLSATSLDEPTAPPMLGEQTATILAELGYSDSDLEAMQADGTLGAPAREPARA
jgi:crotonobetainyl-CoA:carnitine CoA-transferase CaiB-like acyl-CoA transferase